MAEASSKLEEEFFVGSSCRKDRPRLEICGPALMRLRNLLLWSEIGVVLAITGSIGVLSAYSPEAVFGIGLGMFWVGLVGVIFWRRELRRSGKWWARVLVIGLLLRVLVGPVHIMVMNIYYGGHGDIFSYISSAGVTGRDFLKGKIILPKQKRVTDPRNPDYYQVAQPFRLIEFLNGFFYILVGPSAFGLFALAAIIGFFGSYLFWRAFRNQYPEESENRFFVCAIFFSAVSLLLDKCSWQGLVDVTLLGVDYVCLFKSHEGDELPTFAWAGLCPAIDQLSSLADCGSTILGDSGGLIS